MKVHHSHDEYLHDVSWLEYLTKKKYFKHEASWNDVFCQICSRGMIWPKMQKRSQVRQKSTASSQSFQLQHPWQALDIELVNKKIFECTYTVTWGTFHFMWQEYSSCGKTGLSFTGDRDGGSSEQSSSEIVPRWSGGNPGFGGFLLRIATKRLMTNRLCCMICCCSIATSQGRASKQLVCHQIWERRCSSFMIAIHCWILISFGYHLVYKCL